MQTDQLLVILERMERKLDLVVAGHELLRSEIQALAQKTDERFDLVDFKLGVLNEKIDNVEVSLIKRIDAVEISLSNRIDAVEGSLTKHIDAVASDLKAHRRDTEAHQKGYRVSE